MVQRLRIGPGASSPMIVSVPSVDVTGANYLNQVFNANTPTLRVWGTGYVDAYKPASPGALPIPYPVAGPGGFATPGGTFPIFTVIGRRAAGPPLTTAYRNIGGVGGHGGIMSPSGQFIAWQQQSNSLDTTTYVNYCIFRHYG